MNMVARAYVASYLDQNNVLLNDLHGTALHKPQIVQMHPLG